MTGAWRAFASHDPAQLAFVVLAFGGVAAAFASQVLHHDPVLLLDAERLTDVRGGNVIAWKEIEAVHVAKRNGIFDRCHDLVLTVAGEQTLSLPLDLLTRTWSDVVELVEGRLGRPVAIQSERGPITRRARVR